MSVSSKRDDATDATKRRGEEREGRCGCSLSDDATTGALGPLRAAKAKVAGPAARPMRMVVLLLALVLAGCAQRALPPEIEVRNVSLTSATGTIRMWLDAGWHNDTSVPTGSWEFDLGPGARAQLGRLPAEPAEYHYMVVETSDGRSGWGRVLNHAHAATLVIKITREGVDVQPQSVV